VSVPGQWIRATPFFCHNSRVGPSADGCTRAWLASAVHLAAAERSSITAYWSRADSDSPAPIRSGEQMAETAVACVTGAGTNGGGLRVRTTGDGVCRFRC
jgi:hypothetical protein